MEFDARVVAFEGEARMDRIERGQHAVTRSGGAGGLPRFAGFNGDREGVGAGHLPVVVQPHVDRSLNRLGAAVFQPQGESERFIGRAFFRHALDAERDLLLRIGRRVERMDKTGDQRCRYNGCEADTVLHQISQ
mgnify:CR=1 FL=1